MNIAEFFQKYPDEASCIEAFKTKRLAMGLKCKKCGCADHYFRKSDNKFERFAAAMQAVS